MEMTTKDSILWEIRKHKQGWAFSALDFVKKFNRGEIDVALSNLAESGDIRRVIRGIYDYPMYSSILNRIIASDVNQIAKAIARKFNWRICPDGDTALNYLGLSNQMVAKHIYLSDGPSKTYLIDNTSLEFKHVNKKEMSENYELADIVIQAIRSMGEKQITDDFINKLANKFSVLEWEKICENASLTAGWIYDIIKKSKNIAKDRK